jgi:HSP20 family protein
MADIEIRDEQSKKPSRRIQEWPSFFSDPFSWTPFGMMRRMADEMNRVFKTWPEIGQFTESAWPALDAYEEDNSLKIRADLPGMKPDDIRIEVTDNGITLSGERKQEKEERGKGFYRSERSYGEFRRTIPLPEGADIDKAEAEFHDGELQVYIPIPESTKKRRQIPISGKKQESA